MNAEYRPLLMRANRMLGAALVEQNLVRIEDLEAANGRLLEYLSGNDPRKCSVLKILTNDLQIVLEEDVLVYTAENEALGMIDLSSFEVPEDIKKKTDIGECWATWTVQIDMEDDVALVATAHYLSPAVRAHWEKKLGCSILWYITTLEGVASYLEDLGKRKAA